MLCKHQMILSSYTSDLYLNPKQKRFKKSRRNSKRIISHPELGCPGPKESQQISSLAFFPSTDEKIFVGLMDSRFVFFIIKPHVF